MSEAVPGLRRGDLEDENGFNPQLRAPSLPALLGFVVMWFLLHLPCVNNPLL
jgi:hypothetical protein